MSWSGTNACVSSFHSDRNLLLMAGTSWDLPLFHGNYWENDDPFKQIQ